MQSSPEVEFKVGDKAVYPAQGVAEVIKIEEKDIAGTRQRFYVLRILDTERKIMVPVGNAGSVGLRQVISEQEIREIFDILRERSLVFDHQTWNRRYRGFMEKIKTGSIYDVAEVLRDLCRLKTDKQLSFGERRMLETARSLIVKEIAIARDQREEQVQSEIESIFVPSDRSTVVSEERVVASPEDAAAAGPPSTPPRSSRVGSAPMNGGTPPPSPRSCSAPREGEGRRKPSRAAQG